MTIPAIRPGVLPGAYAPEPRTHSRTADAAADAATSQAPARHAAAIANSAPAAAQLSADAPEGTDPALWSVLTPAERAYYARARAQGPLTYTSAASPSASPPARGGRIDVRA